MTWNDKRVQINNKEKFYLKNNSTSAQKKIPENIVEIDLKWIVKLCKDENFDEK